jgi:hypothetical protein
MFDIAFSVVGIFGPDSEEQNAVTNYDRELRAGKQTEEMQYPQK